ncbi:hypothetical protein EZS27_018586 [termite gut metagenome]|uniref:Transmembrane protein n=1 Tax=termite gut metagenome TaxID=433724 RepID=A0A5J4RH16_9ZZZZ
MKSKKIFSICIISLVSIICYLFFQLILPYHLFFKEQLQLFFITPEYFFSYFNKPAALACYIGDFLTQFLYFRGGGAIVITALLLVEWSIVTQVLKRFGCGKLASLWALLPVVAEWILYSELFLTVSLSISFIITLLLFWGYTRIRERRFSCLTGCILIPLIYTLAGAIVFLFPVLAILYDIYTNKKSRFHWILLVCIAGFYPLLIRSFYLLTLKQAYLFPFHTLQFELSAFILAGFILLLQINKIRALKQTALSVAVTTVFIISLLTGGLAHTTDLNREKILALASEAYFNNWEKVYQLAEKEKLPNAVATYYANMALSQRGQLGDKLMEYYQPFSDGLFLSVNSDSNWLTIFFSSDVFFYLGDMNMAQHSAMLGMIFSPNGRSSRSIKRLAEINLINEDTSATRKYLRMLKVTLFHRKAANRLEAILLAENPEDYPWLQTKRKNIHAKDILRLSSDYQSTLRLLVESNPDNKPALDYLLSYYLLHKDIPSFIKVYNTYYKGKTVSVPQVYSEAILIYLAVTKTTPKELVSYGINNRIISNFNKYTELYELSNGKLKAVQDRFPHSYWIYYHFAEIKK